VFRSHTVVCVIGGGSVSLTWGCLVWWGDDDGGGGGGQLNELNIILSSGCRQYPGSILEFSRQLKLKLRVREPPSSEGL